MYSPTQNYSWLFYPPPYDFLAPSRTPALASSPESTVQSMGLGSACNGLGCASCGGTCGDKGMGQTGSGLFGTGLFVSSDPSTWGVGEYAVIAIGGYLAINVITDAQSAGKSVKRSYRRLRS